MIGRLEKGKEKAEDELDDFIPELEQSDQAASGNENIERNIPFLDLRTATDSLSVSSTSSQSIMPIPYAKVDLTALPNQTNVWICIGQGDIDSRILQNPKFDWDLNIQELADGVFIADHQVIGAHVYTDYSSFTRPKSFLLAEITVPKNILSNTKTYNPTLLLMGNENARDLTRAPLKNSYPIHSIYQNSYFDKDGTFFPPLLLIRNKKCQELPSILRFEQYKDGLLARIKSYINKLEQDISANKLNVKRKEIKLTCWNAIYSLISEQYNATHTARKFIIAFPIRKVIEHVVQAEQAKDAKNVEELFAGSFYSHTRNLYDELIKGETLFARNHDLIFASTEFVIHQSKAEHEFESEERHKHMLDYEVQKKQITRELKAANTRFLASVTTKDELDGFVEPKGSIPSKSFRRSR